MPTHDLLVTRVVVTAIVLEFVNDGVDGMGFLSLPLGVAQREETETSAAQDFETVKVYGSVGLTGVANEIEAEDVVIFHQQEVHTDSGDPLAG